MLASSTATEQVREIPNDQRAILVRADGLRVEVAGKVLLEGLDFEIEQGTVCRIVGKNGVGKTTLLRQLLGLIPYEIGEVTWNVELSIGRSVMYFAQASELALLPWLSPLQNVLVGAARARSSKIQPELLRLAASFFRVDAGESLKQILPQGPTSGLSGGERQKVALIRTLIPGARVIILDEPYRELDHQSAEILAKYLSDRVSSGSTLVYVSHYEIGPSLDLELNLDEIACG